jgi:uncharacterized protein (TIGR02246 family)
MAHTPEHLHEEWAERFSAGDVERLVELYEENAVLLPPLPGAELLRGKAAIREELTGLLAAQATFELQETKAVAGDDVAVVYSKWSLKGGSGPDGRPLDLAGQTTDVVRLQADGQWRVAIDNPLGVAGGAG